MNEKDCLPSTVVSPWFRGCLYGGELPGCPSYSPFRVEKINTINTRTLSAMQIVSPIADSVPRKKVQR